MVAPLIAAGAGAGGTAVGVGSAATAAAGGATAASGALTAGGAAAGTSIPAWVPYALKIAGAASGNRNMSALGGALGGLRDDQIAESQNQSLQEVLASGSDAQSVKEEDLLAAGGKTTTTQTSSGTKVTVDIPGTALKALGGGPPQTAAKTTGVVGAPNTPSLAGLSSESSRLNVQNALGQ